MRWSYIKSKWMYSELSHSEETSRLFVPILLLLPSAEGRETEDREE